MDFGKQTQPPQNVSSRPNKDDDESKKKGNPGLGLSCPQYIPRTPRNRLQITILTLILLVVLYLLITYSSTSTPTLDWGETKGEGQANKTFLKRKLDDSETAYQEVVLKRKALLTEDVLKIGAWKSPPGRKSYAFVWDYFPPAFSCPHTLSRIGRIGDGGKWICGFELYDKNIKKNNKGRGTSSSSPCIVYSFGVAGETTFEQEVINRTDCEIYAYDASSGGLGSGLKGVPRAHFEKVFLSKENSGGWFSQIQKTLGSLMKENGHEWIDILKIDIELNEYSVLNQILDEFQEVLPFSQLQVEFHIAQNGKHFQDLVKLWDRLESRGLRPFNFEMNLYKTVGAFFQKWNPDCAEYSFINTRNGKNGQNKLIKSI